MEKEIQYVTDNNGNIKNVILPIEYWRRINADDETEYLLSSKRNKDRLLEALSRETTLSKKEVYERIGLWSKCPGGFKVVDKK